MSGRLSYTYEYTMDIEDERKDNLAKIHLKMNPSRGSSNGTRRYC